MIVVENCMNCPLVETVQRNGFTESCCNLTRTLIEDYTRVNSDCPLGFMPVAEEGVFMCSKCCNTVGMSKNN